MNFKCRGDEKIKLSSQGIYNFQILGNETFIIADYEYAKHVYVCYIEYKVMAKRWQHYVSILRLWLNEFEWI